MVFKKGFITWEWTPNNSLRSAFHPSLYAALFWILKITKMDFNFLINYIPNLFQALLFAIADFCYLRFLKRLFISHQRRIFFKLFRLTFSCCYFNIFASDQLVYFVLCLSNPFEYNRNCVNNNCLRFFYAKTAKLYSRFICCVGDCCSTYGCFNMGSFIFV